MPILRGFTTKKDGWMDDIIDAVNKDPKAKFKLPFKAKNFRSTKNPLKNVSSNTLVDSEGKKQTIKKLSWVTKLFNL